MDQHKLYNTIRLMIEETSGTEEDLLCHVLQSIIRHEAIPIKGGRIWKLDLSSDSYRLAMQMGEMDPIKKNFRLNNKVLTFQIDVFNVLNSNAMRAANNVVGGSLGNATTIMLGRFPRLAVNYKF